MRAFNSYRRCVFTAAAAKTPKALFQTQTRSCSFSSVHWAQPPMSVLKNCAGVSLLCPQQLIGGGSGSGMAKTKADLEMAALGELVAAACSGGGGAGHAISMGIMQMLLLDRVAIPMCSLHIIIGN
eukprot:PhM_4_TR15322/c0_g1_i2/m.81027